MKLDKTSTTQLTLKISTLASEYIDYWPTRFRTFLQFVQGCYHNSAFLCDFLVARMSQVQYFDLIRYFTRPIDYIVY